ncbi:MAG: hypothetical protein IJ764_03065 [Bacteroidales bacterium]|nr:hypothetical protein [Bacteroidales bacterium]
MAKKLGVMFQEWWRHRSWRHKIYDFFLYGFALTGAAILGAWMVYQLGLTNNRGAVDKNHRQLKSVGEMNLSQHQSWNSSELTDKWVEQYVKLIALSHYYPTNAYLITEAAQHSNDPLLVDQMIAAAETYIDNCDGYRELTESLNNQLKRYSREGNDLAVPWMRTEEWEALKPALLNDKALIDEAGRLTGVEPRLIVGCLVGEQIRLFHSKRETVKKYLGPMKVLSVQSQFSYGVNGIKEHTAKWVEENLKNPESEFYMGPDYEHLLDYETDDPSTERYNRLVDYRNHLYSYIYTGCILHQTMLQWQRAGHDISNRPDILFTLFNVGFKQSVPKENPVCGGSRIKIDGEYYTFGAIGFDFYYSGELAKEFPYWDTRFVSTRDQKLTPEEIRMIQEGVSNCKRPNRNADDIPKTNNDPWDAVPYESPSVSPLLTAPPMPVLEPSNSEANEYNKKNTASSQNTSTTTADTKAMISPAQKALEGTQDTDTFTRDEGLPLPIFSTPVSTGFPTPYAHSEPSIPTEAYPVIPEQ